MLVIAGIEASSVIAPGKDDVVVEFDQGVALESVHVNYGLKGPFGAYVDLTERIRASGSRIALPAYNEGQRARSVRAMVYAKGCELATFVLDPLLPGSQRVRFKCRGLRTVMLRGAVTGCPRPSELRLELRYVADWSDSFFGTLDGMDLSLPIAEIVPDAQGRFAIEVPDFASDRVTELYRGQAGWSMTASRTGMRPDVRCVLRTAGQRTNGPGAFDIQREYPKELRFMATPF